MIGMVIIFLIIFIITMSYAAQAGTFWGVLDVLLRASDTQLG